MAQIKAVPEAKPDPKVGTVRRTSPIASPYYNLDQSAEVAKVIHEKAGGSGTRQQLAPWLGYKSVNNGAFVTRVTAAKMFGFIEQDGNQLRTTERGRAIVKPIVPAEADRARADAFLSVPLFKKVFDKFNGQPLPPNVGLRNLLETEYEVVKDRVGPTVKIMLDSAEQSGFFKVAGNRSRLVMPPLDGAPGASAKNPPPPRLDAQDRREFGGGGGNGGGGQDTSRIHPAIYGLIADLPSAGELSAAKRDALIAAFTATVKFIYPDREIVRDD